MTAKYLKGSLALLIFSVLISAGGGTAGALYGQTPPPKNAPADKSKPGAPPLSKPEDDAFKAFLAARTGPPDNIIKLGEDFIAKYPDSHYLAGVYGTLTSAYLAVGQEDKMFAAGAKAVELNPDNVDVLAILAMTIPRRLHATAPDAAQQLQKAEGYAHHVIELIPTLTKPPDMDDAAFEKGKNDELSSAHSGLGLIDIDTRKFEDARTELMLAVQLASNPDPVDYYLLGNADSQSSYYNDAAAAYAKCAASGPLMPQCKAGADKAKNDAATKLGR